MKTKIPQSNKTPKKTTKKRLTPKWREDLIDMGIMNIRTMRDDILVEMGKELVRWARDGIDDPKSRNTSIGKFFALKGISKERYRKWANRNAEFKSLITFAKQIIGEKLKEGLLFKDLEPRSTMFQLHHYDPDWKDMEVYHDNRARLLKNEEQGDKNITIVMEAFPNSSKVPVKED